MSLVFSPREKPKICRECKHHRMTPGHDRCFHPDNVGYDIVTGYRGEKWYDCIGCRCSEDGCGTEGRWYEARTDR